MLFLHYEAQMFTGSTQRHGCTGKRVVVVQRQHKKSKPAMRLYLRENIILKKGATHHHSKFIAMTSGTAYMKKFVSKQLATSAVILDEDIAIPEDQEFIDSLQEEVSLDQLNPSQRARGAGVSNLHFTSTL